MAIPTTVHDLIDRYQNTYSQTNQGAETADIVVRSPEVLDQTVISVLMHDVLGRVQIIMPYNALLDVDKLNSQTSRNLQALSPDDVESIRVRHSLVDLPALPDITGLPCIVDQSVLNMEQIFVAAGDGESLVRFSSDLFATVIEKAKVESFAVPLHLIKANLCDPSEDVAQIHEAIQKFTYLRIKQRLEDTLELPPLPQTAQRIIHLRADPEAGINELSDVVEMDPSLSAQVVSWASSSFYAAPGKVKSVHDAIIRVLGFELVMNLSMGLALGKTLAQPKDEPEGLTPYWHQAVWMATACGALVNLIPRDSRPEFGLTYLAGLLHNLGYLVLAHVFPPHFTLICRYVEANRHLDNAFVEHYLIGITREQVGSKLMQIWNIPEEVVMALRHQKNPEFRGGNAKYSSLLFVARALLVKNGIAIGVNEDVPAELYEFLELEQERAEEVIADLAAARDEILRMAGMMESP
ncbi:YbaK family deacylase [Oleiphilus messinensis]|uniref:YbaK family deacylase n=1 Tax=Oleiphilus messinensis TaxID=141451 RepID=A0A1Y0I7M8_9GAMM|nr:HDOD domain-containing protein [Oleiphilus messinensis]ARU55444.1 YbaK family deacylase [Oleiphilus messinensis]